MELVKKIIIPGNPSTKTAQQDGQRIVKGRYIQHYIKPDVRAEKEKLYFLLKQHAPIVPFAGPLFVRVHWIFSRSINKTEYRITRPDLDNLIKGCADVMTACGFWADDNQIAKYELMKAWNNTKPGIYIEIYKLSDEDLTEVTAT